MEIEKDSELVNDVTEHTILLNSQPDIILQRIESLINNEYLSKDTIDRNS